MANLWRTQRPRLPLYQSDGFGRDYYIKVTNGGFWENESIPQKKPDYVRSKYNNFHTLFHLAAPFKYWGDGSGRENYILKCNGFHHDQKPLCSYQLTDFLRNSKAPRNLNKKVYYSVSENRYHRKLRNLEKKLVKRLYTNPMKEKKKKLQIMAEDKDVIHNKNNKTIGTEGGYGSPTRNNLETQKNEELSPPEHYHTMSSFENNNGFSGKNAKSIDDNNNWHQRCRNKLQFNNINYRDSFKNNTYNNTYYGSFDHKKAIRLQTIDYISPKNNLKLIDSRGKYNRTLKFQQPLINEKILIKKIKIV